MSGYLGPDPGDESDLGPVTLSYLPATENVPGGGLNKLTWCDSFQHYRDVDRGLKWVTAPGATASINYGRIPNSWGMSLNQHHTVANRSVEGAQLGSSFAGVAWSTSHAPCSVLYRCQQFNGFYQARVGQREDGRIYAESGSGVDLGVSTLAVHRNVWNHMAVYIGLVFGKKIHPVTGLLVRDITRDRIEIEVYVNSIFCFHTTRRTYIATQGDENMSSALWGYGSENPFGFTIARIADPTMSGNGMCGDVKIVPLWPNENGPGSSPGYVRSFVGRPSDSDPDRGWQEWKPMIGAEDTTDPHYILVEDKSPPPWAPNSNTNLRTFGPDSAPLREVEKFSDITGSGDEIEVDSLSGWTRCEGLQFITHESLELIQDDRCPPPPPCVHGGDGAMGTWHFLKMTDQFGVIRGVEFASWVGVNYDMACLDGRPTFDSAGDLTAGPAAAPWTQGQIDAVEYGANFDYRDRGAHWDP